MSKVHGLTPAMQTALAERFGTFNPEPIGGGPRRLVEAGKKLYQEGAPDANVPACAACHGPEALGEGITPRLAGQSYRYLTKELANWQKERGQHSAEDTSAIMAPIAESMTQPQIQAVAAYLSHLE
jgi:cytochrome c553